MGRSAKNMKRPTKAEKVSRQINEPSRQPARSLSPDLVPRSAIPLFNSSAKRNLARFNDDIMSVDSSKQTSPVVSDKEMEIPVGEEGTVGDGGKLMKKKSLKDKLKGARESMKETEDRSKEKLLGRSKGKGLDKGKILGGVDYLKLHESRPGGFKKKLR